jgi:hypothetical protein
MRGGRLALAAALVLALTGTVAAQGAGPLGDLIRAQTALIERTREYKETLAPLLSIQQSEAERLEVLAKSRRELYAKGLVARRDAEQAEAAAAVARATADETRQRMGEADALMGETLAAIEIAKTPRAAQSEIVSTPSVIRYQGTVELAASNVASIEEFFSGEFGRPLPISALGQTPTHDRLGFDHRRALDVALHPDSDEGKALIAFLRRERIPFLAFKGPVPGASTGAHIHIGQASPRLPAKAAGG